FKAIEDNPSLLSDISDEPLVQQVAQLSTEEQQRMLYVLLERFQANQQVTLPEGQIGTTVSDAQESTENDA
ncbi:MAG: hypothetical protein AAFX80_10065, partial [Cyanobacteria bacterium J06639_18]